ncbi:MFS transporter [Rhodoferax sp.]|uniref:MFS transporter n=1 Tax=Rhodoferax sp. TaxID=50421 RepID=UPI00283ADAE0|nr:MFS transporter [Rhodoferax sp.]MDR3369965.1 MFS transporter [Rhodoferax sp.]
MMTATAPHSLNTYTAANVANEAPPVAPGDIAIGVIIGRTSEYFDFFVYGIASVLVFPSVFFPFAARLEGMLLAFALFALAFVARPFGTVTFMAIQRRMGREAKLTIALFLLGASTAGIAFLPTYAHVGLASIVLLALFRIGQGIALGGSWDGLPSLLALNAPPARRGWYAMLGQLGAPIGFLLAAGLFAYLLTDISTEDFLDWGWRYPFYVAFAINVVALFARLRLVSTPEYARLLDVNELEPASVVEVVQAQGRNVVIGALAALASYALFHLVTVFPLSWITLHDDQSASNILWTQMVGAALAIVGIVASGLISDHFGRRRTLAALAILIAVFSGVAPTLLENGWEGQRLFILLGFALLGLSYGQASGAVAANFPAKYRYTGAALTSDLAWLAGAGFAPLVVLGLSAHFGLAYVGVYLLSGALGTLAALSINRALEIRD